MTHVRLTTDYSRHQLELRNHNHSNLTQHIKLFSLFKLDGNRWIRVSSCSYTERLAWRVFGDAIASNPLGYRIKAIKIVPDLAQGITRFGHGVR